MPGRESGSDEERLPWLAPHRDAIVHKQRMARRSHGKLVAFAAALAVLFAAGSGYWLGQRDPAPVAPVTEVALAPVSQAPVAQPAPVVPPPIAEATSPVEAETAPVVKKAAVSKPKKPIRRAVRQRKIRNANIQSARQKQVRAAQIRTAQRRARAARQVPRAWPKMPSPGPAGQVIQLGAFRNPAGANRAYRTRLARYPMLGSMPRVVVPVITKPRGQVLYVLRLGTSSRQQSKVVCRNLRASGNHCLVIG